MSSGAGGDIEHLHSPFSRENRKLRPNDVGEGPEGLNLFRASLKRIMFPFPYALLPLLFATGHLKKLEASTDCDGNHNMRPRTLAVGISCTLLLWMERSIVVSVVILIVLFFASQSTLRVTREKPSGTTGESLLPYSLCFLAWQWRRKAKGRGVANYYSSSVAGKPDYHFRASCSKRVIYKRGIRAR